MATHNPYTVIVHTSSVMGAALNFMEIQSPHFWHSTAGLTALRAMYAIGNLSMAKQADFEEASA